MLKHPQLTLSRIERFLRNEIEPKLWERQIEMQAAVHRPEGDLPTSEAAKQTYTPVKTGYTWGPIWSNAWFRLSAKAPAAWQGEKVCARIDLGAEAIVWDGDNPLQGIDWAHGEIKLSEAVKADEEFTLYVRATGMNPSVSCDGKPKDPPAEPFTFKHAYLAVLDTDLFALYFDMRTALGVLREQPENEPRYGQLLYALNEAINAYDEDDRTTIATVREIVAKTYCKPATASAHEMSAIGHAHIDTAWLWPLERTQQKCIHTFSTATRYMDDYPEYCFVASQAAQYEWIKQMAPKLYERIRAKVEKGQWEITGSMWVEADCNITGGESLVRQLLLAKNYWMDEFGVETVDLWLPDVFGYSAALPQILTKAGVKYFLTQKISWNQLNKFPHHTFLWQGIDGTSIFTHFPPADTYNGAMSPKELAYNVHNFKDKDRANRSMYLFGHGDGGGGPTVEMLETMRRVADIEGMPKVKPEFARTFFEKAQQEAKDLPVWVGELYLELHRGTYTTQAKNKRGNRKSEFLLRDAELLASMAPGGLANYPAAELERAWKLLLINQFHDIIPGSSINEVYKDSARDYAEIEAIGNKIVTESLRAIAASVDTQDLQMPVLAVRNYDDGAYGKHVQVKLETGATPKSVHLGEYAAPVQIVEQDGANYALFQEQVDTDGHGYAVYDLRDTELEDTNRFIVTERLLDNGDLRVEFDENGLISRIYDQVNDREVLAEGQKANQLQLFEDKPLYWDAWDVDVYYQEKGRVITELDSIEVVEEGPVRGALRITRSFGKSKIVQTVRLDRKLEFVTEVDWHEDHKLLKAAFPVAINSAKATYEIQYGHVERPTHYNTSWDLARFEVAAQKWVDLSEGDYGVALMNDCKYGHDVFGNTMRLTLLRSPKAPDPEADMGRQVFTYALLPHAGNHIAGRVVEEAYNLNAPVRATMLKPGVRGVEPQQKVWFEVNREGVIIEAVKKAEKQDALIVRLYEANNSRGKFTLKTTLPVKTACITDLLERDIQPIAVDGGAITAEIKPFEIITLKLTL